MATYKDFHRRSIDDPSGFWAEQARLVDWHKPFTKVLDYSKPPKTTEWMAPSRAHASIATTASGTIGM